MAQAGNKKKNGKAPNAGAAGGAKQGGGRQRPAKQHAKHDPSVVPEHKLLRVLRSSGAREARVLATFMDGRPDQPIGWMGTLRKIAANRNRWPVASEKASAAIAIAAGSIVDAVADRRRTYDDGPRSRGYGR